MTDEWENPTKRNYSPEIGRLYLLTIYARWCFILFCWLTLGIGGIWGLRDEIKLWLEYFTWSALRYGLATHFLSTLCLVFCVALTMSVLVWQSRNILFGLPPEEIDRLEGQLQRIIKTGNKHPLWRWVFPETKESEK
jgi:hypothetical protein